MISDMAPDARIIEQVLQGDSAAYAILVNRHRQMLLNYLWRMLRQADDVEEIGQEVFLQAYRHLGRFDPARGVPFSAWLVRIARNRCLNHLKKRQHDIRHREALDAERPNESPAGPLVETDAPEDLLHRRQLADALQTRLAGLAPEFRETFVLVAINGMPVATAAHVQGVAVGTIKSRLARARRALNETMEAHHAA